MNSWHSNSYLKLPLACFQQTNWYCKSPKSVMVWIDFAYVQFSHSAPGHWMIQSRHSFGLESEYPIMYLSKLTTTPSSQIQDSYSIWLNTIFAWYSNQQSKQSYSSSHLSTCAMTPFYDSFAESTNSPTLKQSHWRRRPVHPHHYYYFFSLIFSTSTSFKCVLSTQKALYNFIILTPTMIFAWDGER